MKTLTLSLALALVLAGCSGKEPGADTASRSEEPAASATPAADAASGQQVVTLTGTIGCGHCTFEVVDRCHAAMTTPDGVVYLLEGVDQESELFTERFSGKEIRVVGVPRDQDGHHYLSVKSHEM